MTALEEVMRLHRPINLWLPYFDAEFSFETYDEAVEYHLDPENMTQEEIAAAVGEITSFAVCDHCRAIEREQAADRGYEHAAWPCRTALCWLDPAKIYRPTEETP